jgi:hypothetical protein
MAAVIEWLTFRAGLSAGALAADKLPAELQLLRWGRNASTRGELVVDEAAARALGANQARAGFAEVAIDFEHNTVPGSPEFARTAEPRPVAGYGTPEIRAGQGLFLKNIRWTPSGEANAKLYADLSPAVRLGPGGSVELVHSVALTRNGAVEGLTFHSADENKKENMNEIEKLTGEVTALATRLGAVETALKGAEITALSARLGKMEEAEKSRLVVLFAQTGKVPKDKEGKPLSMEALGAMTVEDLLVLHANSPGNIVPLSAQGGPAAPARAAGHDQERARLVGEIQLRNRCNFQAAWDQARREKPELFGA